MKILHVVKKLDDEHHEIHKVLKNKLNTDTVDVLFATSRDEYHQLEKTYDVVHFLNEELMFEWGVSGDIVTINNYENFQADIAKKCLRVITPEKSMAAKMHLDHNTFNHQHIPRCVAHDFNHEKVYEAYKSLYINVGMERRGMGIVVSNEKEDHRNAMISFGGLGNRFNFWNILKELKAKKIFLKDQYHSWYQRGVYENINSVEKVAEELKKILKENKIDYTVVVGDSAGGCAAIQFGHLIGADVVLSFNAQTFVTQVLRGTYKDNRWEEMAMNYLSDNAGFNLKDQMVKSNGKTKYFLFYSYGHGLDRIHNEMLSGLPGINLMPIDCNYHGVAGELKKLGYLKPMLDAVCEKKDLSIINEIKAIWKPPSSR